MTIDSTPETWHRVVERRQCDCGKRLEQTFDTHHDASVEVGAIGVLECTNGCGKRYAVYLSATTKGVEAIP